VQISDIWVEDTDLVIATHGRSFYVLDDIGPLRQFNAQFGSTSDVFLFAPEDAIRSYRNAQIKYFVKKPAQNAMIEVIDPKGTVVRTFRSGGAAPAADPGRGGGGGGGRPWRWPRWWRRRGGGAGLPMNPGFNTVTWNLQYDPATSFPGMILWGGGVQGPMGAPGTYQVA
jgi:hypothetical protein